MVETGSTTQDDDEFLDLDHLGLDDDSSAAASNARRYASIEAAKLNAGTDLENDAKLKDHGRTQSFRDNADKAAKIVFWCLILCIVWSMVVYAFHKLTPWGFLGSEQIDKIETFLTAVLFSSALSGYVNKRLAD